MRFVRFSFLSIFLFLLTLQLNAQTSTTNPYPPKRLPDRINLTVTEDPSTSAAVTWRTNVDVKEGYAEILLADANPLSIKNAKKIKAKTEYLETYGGREKELTWGGSEANYHSVIFTDLEPNTMYTYRVGSGDDWSEWFQFRTTSDKPEPFSFLYFGDAQSDIRSMWSKVIRQAYADAPQALLMLHAGDLIDNSTRDEEWGEWFEAGGFIHATVRNMPSPGNHDYGRGDEVEELSPFWRPQFTLPENGPEGLEETCYYSDIQGVRFISLDSYPLTDLELYVDDYPMEKLERDIEIQKTWLEGVLRDNPNQWTVVVFHHPIISPKTTRDNVHLRENFKPLFDKYKVDLVLQGHDHAYTRGMKKVPMEGNEPSGTMYVVSVSGPKMSDNLQEKKIWMDKIEVYTQLYHVIDVDSNKMQYRAYTPMGEVFDAFELIKRPGEVNEIKELMRFCVD